MTNATRANAASKALTAYARAKEGTPKRAANYLESEDMTTKAADLLADLLHLSGGQIDLEKAIRFASGNYDSEK